jgi:REP element-mobilizing transposase RayT
MYLNAEQAALVVERLVTSAAEREWRILRAAVMSNHVHVVVVDCPEDGPGVRRGLKGPTQARLSEHASGPRRWWTQGGSDRYLYSHDAIQRAVNYVARQHGILAQIVDMVVVKK